MVRKSKNVWKHERYVRNKTFLIINTIIKSNSTNSSSVGIFQSEKAKRKGAKSYHSMNKSNTWDMDQPEIVDDIIENVKRVDFADLPEDASEPTEIYRTLRNSVVNLQKEVTHQNEILIQMHRAFIDECENNQKLHLMILGKFRSA